MNRIMDAYPAPSGEGRACFCCDEWVRSTKPRIALTVEGAGRRVACLDCGKHDDELRAALAATARGDSSDLRVVNLDAALAAAIHNGRG